MDANEATPQPDSVTLTITFNSDASATVQDIVSGVDQGSSTFNWKLTNNDKDLVISVNGSSDTLHIESLTATDLETSSQTSNIGGTYKIWTFFHKQ